MKLAKITTPVKNFTGHVAGVAFADGVGHTDVAHIVDWFRRHGYGVDAQSVDTEEVKKAAAGELEDNFADEVRGRASEDAAVSKGWTDEMRREEFGEGVGTLVNNPGGAPIIDKGVVATTAQIESRKAAARGKTPKDKPEAPRKSSRKRPVARNRKTTVRRSTSKPDDKAGE